jgi:hypothetical protein
MHNHISFELRERIDWQEKKWKLPKRNGGNKLPATGQFLTKSVDLGLNPSKIRKNPLDYCIH